MPGRAIRHCVLAVALCLMSSGCLLKRDRSFGYSSDPSDAVLYMLAPSQFFARPRSEYTLYGDCRLERSEVYGGSPLQRIGDPAEYQLLRDECEELISSVVNSGFLDADKEARDQRLRRVLSTVIDSSGVFIRIRLTRYHSSKRWERRPFEEYTGANRGLINRVPPIDHITDEMTRRDLVDRLRENKELLRVWDYMEETYGPDVI